MRGIGIADEHLGHEAVELRLGERVGALELDGVLGREHCECRGQRVPDAIHSDGTLLHRLEQCGLCFRGRPVDLVGQHQIGKDRTRSERELASAAQERDAGDVGGHQVGGELDALELDVQRERQYAHQQRLGGSGHALEQHVTASEQADERLAGRRLLAEDHAVERL